MRFSVLFMSVTLLALLRPVGSSSARTVQEPGWYSTAQADSGADAYYHRCAACHGVHLEGHKGKALAGPQFFSRYGGKPMSKFWLEVSTKMPPSAPGSIPQPEALNILAYIFRQNGLPGGADLSVATQDLERVIPKKPPTKS